MLIRECERDIRNYLPDGKIWLWNELDKDAVDVADVNQSASKHLSFPGRMFDLRVRSAIERETARQSAS